MKELGYIQLFRHFSHKAAIDLAEKLLALSPAPMSKVMFQCSGSEANDAAVKILWLYWRALGKPQKRKIISRKGSYHGTTCVATSMTGNSHYHESYGLPFDGFLHTELPNYYRYGDGKETEEQFSQRMADALENMILREGPETIAAFWADPVQASAGALPPPQGYFDKIVPILRKYDILFASDEVVTGFGRTGKMWGSEHYGLKPDIMVCAKALSAAMQPISALFINERIFDVLKVESDRVGAFVHGYTYGGHPVAAAVALEALKIYEEMDVLKVVERASAIFQDELTKLKDHPLVGDASWSGLMGGIEIVADKDKKTAFPAHLNMGERLYDNAERNGLVFRWMWNRLAFSPCFTATEQELRDLGKRTRRVLDDTLKDVRAHVKA
jgi:4-aminobutyrate--pyruvate transaminase